VLLHDDGDLRVITGSKASISSTSIRGGRWIRLRSSRPNTKARTCSRGTTASTSGTYLLDVVTGKLVSATLSASAFYRDSITGFPYGASGTTINALFNSATKRTAQWKTPIIALDSYPSFGWLQVQSAYESSGTITVSIYGDGTLIQTQASRVAIRSGWCRATSASGKC
jgi:hypothetical protein